MTPVEVRMTQFNTGRLMQVMLHTNRPHSRCQQPNPGSTDGIEPVPGRLHDLFVKFFLAWQCGGSARVGLTATSASNDMKKQNLVQKSISRR